RLSRPKDDIAEGVVRVGGDEFVVLLRGVSDQSTVDSIQSRIHQRLMNAGVSASIGGRPHLPGESASDLLAATDMLMLRIKRLHHKERIDTLDPPRKIAYYLGRQLLRMSGVNRSAWMR
ncbi:MAG: hypothetical protein ABIV43_00830, partial [Candidatus Saccharimonadales bacterium]